MHSEGTTGGQMCDFVVVVANSWDSESNNFLLFSPIDGTILKPQHGRGFCCGYG